MDRRFVRLDEFRTSPEATALWGHIMSGVRSAMEQHRDCELSELQTILDGMNAAHADITNRFAYCEFLGGLVHIQISHVAGESFWVMLPTSADIAPVDRLAMQPNGLVCTRAPADALVAWPSSPGRHDMSINADGGRGFVHRVCANCDETHNLRTCTGCKLVRYCGSQCQQSHWRVGHRPLCKWAKACIDRQFGTTSILRL